MAVTDVDLYLQSVFIAPIHQIRYDQIIKVYKCEDANMHERIRSEHIERDEQRLCRSLNFLFFFFFIHLQHFLFFIFRFSLFVFYFLFFIFNFDFYLYFIIFVPILLFIVYFHILQSFFVYPYYYIHYFSADWRVRSLF